MNNLRKVRTCLGVKQQLGASKGRYALISMCRTPVFSLHQSLDEAMAEKETIDDLGCGGRCYGQHRIEDLKRVAC